MKRVWTSQLALLAILAFSAIAAAVASAEEGFLPHKLNGFIVEGGKTTLNTPANQPITCSTLDASKGSLENDKHGTVILHFLGCSFAGLGLNTVGDKSGEVLFKVLLLVCLKPENAEKKLLGEFGIAVETDETVTAEVPALGVKITLKGRVIGLVLAKAKELLKVFPVDFTGKEGKQEVQKCVEGEKVKEHTLQAESSSGKKLETASLSIEKHTITFEETQELMDS